MRMAHIPAHNTTVVDLFAGIGFFTIPMVVKAGAGKVFACEWNPAAVEALQKNVVLNKVEGRVEIREGDCREVRGGWVVGMCVGFGVCVDTFVLSSHVCTCPFPSSLIATPLSFPPLLFPPISIHRWHPTVLLIVCVWGCYPAVYVDTHQH